jgi:uncharacterized protein YdaU (DUF1376 family)
MNYFELYGGDYLRDTSRLGLIDHGAYLKLMLAYYGEEQPLPAPYDDLYQICAAISAADKCAVRKVADKYFPVASDGLRHKKRIDEEIAKAQKRMEIARQNGGKGGRPHKPTNNPAGYPAGSVQDNPEETRWGTQSGEALHTPHATSLNQSSRQALNTAKVTEAGRACRLMREAGCGLTSPSSPDLLAALAEGVTAEALADTVREGVEAGKAKPFAWAVATARGRHAEGARAISTGPPRNGHPPSKQKSAIAALLGNSHEITESADLVCDRDTPRISNASRA